MLATARSIAVGLVQGLLNLLHVFAVPEKSLRFRSACLDCHIDVGCWVRPINQGRPR